MCSFATSGNADRPHEGVAQPAGRATEALGANTRPPAAVQGRRMSGPPIQSLADDDLLAAIRVGDSDALCTLLQRYWPRLVAYSQGILGGNDGGEDVAQEVFIRVWERRLEMEQTGTVVGYLYRSTRNLSLNAVRDRKLRETRQRESELLPAPRPDPLQAAEAEALRNAVRSALSALPPRRREVIVLSRYHGLSHREIAEAMDISLQTVANHAVLAMAELRDRLARCEEE